MTEPFSLEELAQIVQLAADEASSEAAARATADRSSPFYKAMDKNYSEAKRLEQKAKKLHQELFEKLDALGELVQDFVVIAFRAFEGDRYSFVNTVQFSEDAKGLLQKGFTAVVWPDITRTQAVARFIDPVFQQWLQTCYNANAPIPPT